MKLANSCCRNILLTGLTILAAVGLSTATFALPGDGSPSGLKVKNGSDGKVMLSWGLPAAFSSAGLLDSPSDEGSLLAIQPGDAVRDGKEVKEMPRNLDAPSGYPLTLGTGASAQTLLGYRVMRDGVAVTNELLTRRYFVAQGAGEYTVEAVYEDGRAVQSERLMPDQQNRDGEDRGREGSLDWSCYISNIDISNYPRVIVNVESDWNVLPMSAFSIEEEGTPMTLLQECFEGGGGDQLIDVCLVVDRGGYMNDYICDLAWALDCIGDDLPDCIDLKFALVFYGNDGSGNSACGNTYWGSPKHENTSSLRSIWSARDRLNQVGGYSLNGNQEPAYDAIDCGLNATPWRAGSRRIMLLISSENNDHCTWNGNIPQISIGDLEDDFDAVGATFYAWTRYNVLCDCYDFCTNHPSCSNWYDSGCNSGYADFHPLAEHTGGATENICNSIWDLLDEIDFDGECSSQRVCYDAGCCVPGDNRSVRLRISYNGETCTDWDSYCQYNCNGGSSHDPWINCWTGNPTGFTPGDPVTVCVEAGDEDGNLASVRAHYSFGGCNETVDAESAGGNRWCVTIPGSCTNASGDLTVHFTATDACENWEGVECTIPNTQCLPPDIACWSRNPETYAPGHDVTVCAVVRCADDDDCGDDDGDHDGDDCDDDDGDGCDWGDDCNDDDDDCHGDDDRDGCWRDRHGEWHDRDCNRDHENEHCDGDNDGDRDWQDGDGEWHDRHCDGYHGDGGDDECDGDNNDRGDWQDGSGRWHDEDCDGDHDDHDGQDCPAIETVTAIYSINGCDFTGPATRLHGTKYCITVPASCLWNCEDLVVRFVAVNECGEQAEVSCTVICDTCVLDPDDYRTQTQGGWGQNWCSGGNVRCFLNQWFPVCFPGGITVGGGFTANFTSAGAIGVYLPRGTTVGVLTQNYTNPTTTTSAGVFLSQVLALGLNIGFSDCDQSGFGEDLGPLEIAEGPFEGWTVDELYVLANEVLGGNLGALPAGKTLSQLNEAVDNINNNFNDGNCDNDFLRRVCDECEPPSVVCWPGNPHRFPYGEALNVCAVVTDPNGGEHQVTASYSAGGCNTPATPVEVSPGVWCVTIPANCTQTYENACATFTVTDECGTRSVTCCIPACIPPVLTPWNGNPGSVNWGSPLTVCETVNDGDGDLASVRYHYVAGECDATGHATYTNGRYCVTVPGNCTQYCGQVMVVFIAEDSCGNEDHDTIRVPVNNTPPVVACWGENPTTFTYGHPLTVCATVTDGQSNVTGVTASYNTGDGCNASVPANFTNGRWCVTIPEHCTRTCANIAVTFTATDACGLIDTETCTVNACTTPPVANCFTGNPAHYAYGQPLTMCVTTSGCNPIHTVTGSYNTGDGCNTTVPATFAEGRWCITIPGNCTQTCAPIVVTFLVTDVCGRTATRTCTANSSNTPPTVACFTGNPGAINYGQPVTICAIASDAENCIQGVTASYNIGPGCSFSGPANLVEGRWCVTIPASCTRLCGTGGNPASIAVTFRATDCCGALSNPTICTVNVNNQPPTAVCWGENPVNFVYGQPVTLCAIVSDPNGNVREVRASYNTGLPGCNQQNIPATNVAGNRWCITIPANCTETCSNISVTFTATDSCNMNSAPVTCTVNSTNTPPSVACFTGNPASIFYGQPVTICATAFDQENCLEGVSASWNIGPNCTYNGPATFSEGRWCVTIPANCTRLCGQGGNPASISVTFRATDCCNVQSAPVTCTVNVVNRPPTAACFTGNPQHYTYGQPVIMCATASDLDGNLQRVRAQYNLGDGCIFDGDAIYNGAVWCVTIPGTCTQRCTPISVTFTPMDSCGVFGVPVTCIVNGTLQPPVVDCWPGNPSTYAFGEPVTICGLVSDPDNNVTGVTGRYLTTLCDVTVPATNMGAGRWCITIPGNCTQSTADLFVIFTATDACGSSEDDTCRIPAGCIAPEILCWEDNPTGYQFGQPLTMCAVVTNLDGDPVTVTGLATGGSSCNHAFAASDQGGGRWCATIPESCTQSTDAAIIVSFYVVDACGLRDTVQCVATPNTQCPPIDINCWPGNPAYYDEGQSVTVCAFVDDPVGYVNMVQGRYLTPNCDQIVGAINQGGGVWCLTVPAGCTNNAGPVRVVFTAYNICGFSATSDTCTVTRRNRPPSVICWPGNPTEFTYGAPLELCAQVSDPDGNVTGVTGHYIADGCDLTVPAVDMGGGRWCVTIPAACTATLNPISITFTATDAYGATDTETCGAISACDAPQIVCWSGNPTEFDYAVPVTVCATVYDADADVQTVMAHIFGEHCDETVPAVPDGNGNMCVTIPGTCTESYQPISVTFTATDRCYLNAEVTCTLTPPPPLNECCFMCVVEHPIVFTSSPVPMTQTESAQVIQITNNRLWLSWNETPQASFYQIYCANEAESDLTDWRTAGFIPHTNITSWIHPLTVPNLPEECYFTVQPRRLTTLQVPCEDRGRWEFNVCLDDIVPDASGNDRDATGWFLCAPNCSTEYDTLCNDAFTGYAHFEGYVYPDGGDRCEEHYRVTNDSIFYVDRFQVWSRIRIFEHPTISTGPRYIISNASLDVEHGGWFIRLDPARIMRNGQWEYHNRLTAGVWNAEEDAFMLLQSPAPTPDDTTFGSVPLGVWSCICLVVNGNQSMLIIDGRVVAAGDMILDSHNNGVPLVIGAGYRHNTNPIEYPFVGDMDCIRYTEIGCEGPNQ